MRGSAFFYFLILELFRGYKRHTGIVAMSILIIFMLSSALFVSDSIKYSLQETLQAQPDFTIQRIRGGQRVDMPIEWMDELIEINGIQKVTTRVYGRFFFKDKGSSALIVGVDMMDEQSHRALEKLINEIDLKKFLDGDQMIIGDGIKRYLEKSFYLKHYNFLTPDGKYRKVEIFHTLSDSMGLLSNDLILMPQELAKEILGIDDDKVTDIAFNIPNDELWDSITDKVSALHYDIRVVNKDDIKKAYEHLYNYKGGFFLTLFLISILTFALILYQRFSIVGSDYKRDIGILRALGWSIADVLTLKIYETTILIVISFVLGVALAYGFVFLLDAPLIKNIFVGGAGLDTHIKLIPVLDFTSLGTILLFFAVPFMASVVIPVWRIAVTDPKEAML